MQYALILLAGGKGERFQSPIPKQFLPLKDKPLVLHSLEILLSLDIFSQKIIVCDASYHFIFEKYQNIIFAPPGKRRQDSVFSALEKIKKSIDFVCIHDAARPYIQQEHILKLIKATQKEKAVALGMPCTNTIKYVDKEGYVQKTLPRSSVWEIQTPQIIAYDLLIKGMQKAKKENIEVTDDVSLIELLQEKIHIIPGCYSNKKITTPQDLLS